MRKLFTLMLAVMLLTFLLASVPAVQAQTYYGGAQTVLNPTASFAAQTFTASAQTGTKINLQGYSYGVISVVGNSLSTATWAIQGSNDGGLHYFPINSAVITTPGTVATTQTSTANGMYIVNLAGLTNVQFVTSGVFTATSISIKLTATANKGLL